MRFSYVLFIAVIFAMAGYSCRKKGSKNLNQGEIHYNIDYIGKVGPMPKEVLPKTMVMSFKDDKILFEMLSTFGNSGIQNLSNPDKGILDTYFSLFSLRYFCEAEPGEIYPGFEAMEGMVLKKTSKTAVLCGLNCKNFEVTFPHETGIAHDIWYTDEINIKNPNASTPFYEIEGVLMNFFFYLGSSELHFNAETVYNKNLPDETFERKKKFTRVSREEINNLINTYKF